MPAGETAAHQRLKELAITWAREAGLPIAAREVRVSRSGFRVDVAAYAHGTKNRLARTALFECKQTRADLLKDSRAQATTRERLAGLNPFTRFHPGWPSTAARAILAEVVRISTMPSGLQNAA